MCNKHAHTVIRAYIKRNVGALHKFVIEAKETKYTGWDRPQQLPLGRRWCSVVHYPDGNLRMGMRFNWRKKKLLLKHKLSINWLNLNIIKKNKNKTLWNISFQISHLNTPLTTTNFSTFPLNHDRTTLRRGGSVRHISNGHLGGDEHRRCAAAAVSLSLRPRRPPQQLLEKRRRQLRRWQLWRWPSSYANAQPSPSPAPASSSHAGRSARPTERTDKRWNEQPRFGCQ